MENFDLAVSYVWEYDVEFVSLIEKILQPAGIRTYIIHGDNVDEVTELLKSRLINFGFYLDRASDVDERFSEIAKMLTRRKIRILNAYSDVEHAIDKASMHLEFITAGLNVPYSIIIPPHSEKEMLYISVDDLAVLGRPFIIKPCNTTGGGIGVVTGAESLKEIFEERVTNKNDKYLLQEKVYPALLDGKRAWFRCFWAFGNPIPTWWDDQTHIYSELTAEQISNYKLKKLDQILRIIYKITRLDFFSTEIVLTGDGKFVVIDYVNDQCDMRLQSQHQDGIPDRIIEQIINNLGNFILKEKRRNK
ncbi:MAG: hypothetical protein HXY49_09100 [Ignavibacteriaceae bacterium]|nr:hypothetical protein [Ignavibacteriaceae bacterium]